MRLGSCNGIKPLTFLLLLTSNVFANPVIGVFEGAMESYFIAAGVDANQAKQDARNLSKSVFDDQVKKDIQEGSYEFNESSSFFKSTFDKQTSKNIEFREKKVFSDGVNASMANPYKKGGEGIIFHVEDAGNWQDKEVLRKMYKDIGFDIVFKTRVSYAELTDYMKSQNGISYAIAPDWYGSSGMFLYRTELPINKDGDYFYANKPFTFYDIGLNGGLIKMDEKVVEIDLGYDLKGLPVRFPIYEENFKLYDDENDAILSFNGTYGRKYSLEYTYEKRIIDHSSEDIENQYYGVRQFKEAKEYCENGGVDKIIGPGNSAEYMYTCLNRYLKISNNAVGIPHEGKGVLLLEKNREDIDENSTLVDRHDNGDIDDDDTVSIFESLSKLAEDMNAKAIERLSRFELTPDSVAEIYTNEIKHTLKNNSSSELNLSAQAKASLDSSFEISPEHVRASARTGGFASGGSGGSGVTVNDITRPVSEFKQWFEGGRTSSSVTIHHGSGSAVAGNTDKKPKPLPPPPITGTGGIGEIGISGSGTHIGGKGESIGGTSGTGTISIGGTHTGSGTGGITGSGTQIDTSGSIGTVGSQTGTGAKTGEVAGTQTQAGTSAGEATDTPKDDKVDLPLIPEAGNILKPLLDWRANLLAQFNIGPPSGTCPSIRFTIFEESVEVDAHCLVYEQIAGIISAFMFVVWSIAAFRVLFSA